MTDSFTKVIPTLMATGLVFENAKYLQSKKKRKPFDLIGLGVTNIVGLSLIDATSDFTGGSW